MFQSNVPTQTNILSSESRKKTGQVPFFQPKLTVNTPGDAHEQEADRVADQVMRMKEDEEPMVQRMPLTPVNSVQRMCADCEEKQEAGVQRKETTANHGAGSSAPSIVGQVLSSGEGQPMDAGTRQFMESRFGQDFGQVRIHTGSQAAESAAAIQAKAYTSGRDVVFGRGEYRPQSGEGKRLLAHELVHVGQQGNVRTKSIQRKVDAKNVSCADIPKDPKNYPIYKAMKTLDPLGEIQNADARAIQLLNDTISVLQKGVDHAKKTGNAPSWPDFNDCLGSALQHQMLLDPNNVQTWIKEGPGTVSHVTNRYSKLKNLFEGGFVQYICISNDCDNEVAFVWKGQKSYNLKMCRKFWQMGLDDRALTFIHELSHVYFKTVDHGFKGPGAAHCLEQFVAAVNFIPVPKEFQNACNYKKMGACKM